MSEQTSGMGFSPDNVSHSLRCDLHGPYTPEQAAALVLGAWKPEPTGYLCAECRAGVAVAAQSIADRIDAEAAKAVYGETR